MCVCGGGGGVGCERRIEVIMKMQNSQWVDVNKELNLLCKMQKFEAPSCNNFQDIMITNFRSPNLQKGIIKKNNFPKEGVTKLLKGFNPSKA